MVNVLAATGANFNNVARAYATTSGSISITSPDALFPPKYFCDYLTEIAGRFGDTSSGGFTVDQNIIANGGMENATTSAASTLLANWTVVSGVVTQSGTNPRTGSFAMQLVGGVAQEDITVNTGERFTFTASVAGNTVNSGRVQVQNPQTFSYLTSSGGWQAAQTYFLTATATSYNTRSVTSSIEAFGSTGSMKDTMPLRITINGSATSATVYADDIYYTPAVSLVSLHGFLNIDPGITVKILSSASSGFTTATTEMTMAKYLPSMFYAPATPIDNRFIAFQFTGTQSTISGPIYGGEIVLTQATTLNRVYDPSVSLEFRDTQSRSQTVQGSQRVVRLDQHPTRTVSVPYRFYLLADYQQVRDAIYRRSGFGTYPTLIVPNSTNAEVCIWGRVEERWVTVEGPMVGYHEGSKLVVTETGFPVWTA